jgi:beta-glucosidase-like glycosyl hydrolase
MRIRWNLPNVHVTTDCGAISNLRGLPAMAPDDATAAAWALMNGSDIEMGSTVWTSSLVEAVHRGLATEEALDQALRRSYRPHFVAGRFDDPAASEWSYFGLKDINSKYHQQIQLEAALQGLVLLKHELKMLPIQPGSKIAVLGPLGQTRAGLMSDYENDESCFGGGHDCIPTLAESIAVVNGPLTTSASGVDIDSSVDMGIPEALGLAANADVIILCLGSVKAR